MKIRKKREPERGGQTNYPKLGAYYSGEMFSTNGDQTEAIEELTPQQPC